MLGSFRRRDPSADGVASPVMPADEAAALDAAIPDLDWHAFPPGTERTEFAAPSGPLARVALETIGRRHGDHIHEQRLVHRLVQLDITDSERAQRSLFDDALAAGPDDQVALLGYVANSVKRFGDKAEKRHVDALVDLVANSTGDVAEAAATVHGALNIPSTDAYKLIP